MPFSAQLPRRASPVDVGLLQAGALPLRLACHVLGGEVSGHTRSSPPAGNSKQLQLKVPASCWLAFLEEQRPARARQTTRTPTAVRVLHWNSSPAHTSCPNALCTRLELGLLTPPANHVSSQAPRHAAKSSPTGPPSAGAGAPPSPGGWRVIPTLMGFLGAGTRASSPLKIAEEAGCQVLFLPHLLFKGLCEIFIKINQIHQPAASPVPRACPEDICAQCPSH